MLRILIVRSRETDTHIVSHVTDSASLYPSEEIVKTSDIQLLIETLQGYLQTDIPYVIARLREDD